MKSNEDSEEQSTKEKMFICSNCDLRERYDYFGKEIPFTKVYKLNEDAYLIEDPFLPPKQGEFLVLGSHCLLCSKAVCKDPNCSIYFNGTHCIVCAKENCSKFPEALQEKLNKLGSI